MNQVEGGVYIFPNKRNAILFCNKTESLGENEVPVTRLCPALCNPMDYSSQGSLSMEFPRQDYWSGLLTLFQGVSLTQGSNLGFPHCRQILYHLGHQERASGRKGPLLNSFWLPMFDSRLVSHPLPPLLLSVQRHWAGCCQGLALREVCSAVKPLGGPVGHQLFLIRLF